MRLSILPIIALGLIFVGCPAPSATEQMSYTDQAEASYAFAMEAFEDEEHLEAMRRFKIVQTKYPYSQYATLAELRVADVLFEQGRFQEAAEFYRGFSQRHPTHAEVAYARYRIAICYQQEIHDDWFLMPAGYERDQTAGKEARQYFQHFLKIHPDSKYADEARERLAEVENYLASHEFYVATFYIDRDKPLGAIGRLEGILENYPNVGYDAKALFLLARCYLELSDVRSAVDYLQRLIAEHPDDPLAEDAQSYLEEFNL